MWYLAMLRFRFTTALVMTLAAMPLTTMPAKGEDGFRGTVSLAHHHHFQGFRQNFDDVSVYGSAQYHVGRVSTGIWVGRYDFPGGFGSTAEVDYFVGFSEQVGFRHRLETSLWHYTYRDDAMSRYNWTQWLGRYHYDEWLTVTLGAADNLLRADRTAWLLECLIRRSITPDIAVNLSVGRNQFNRHVIESFSFLTFKAVMRKGDWIVALDHTETTGDHGFTGRWVHDGVSFSLTYSFD